MKQKPQAVLRLRRHLQDPQPELEVTPNLSRSNEGVESRGLGQRDGVKVSVSGGVEDDRSRGVVRRSTNRTVPVGGGPWSTGVKDRCCGTAWLGGGVKV
jgi:hypothetical protein